MSHSSWISGIFPNLHLNLRFFFSPQMYVITENEDNATHIIYPTCDPLEEEYARPTFRRDRMVMLHWYYFPDSYDSWTAADLPVDTPDSPQPRIGPWRVRAILILYNTQ
jgi:SWI/SNF related-matrix-associated actin-dependent regulator of chromatin subfamily C